MREHHYGEERAQTDAEHAERMVREGLNSGSWAILVLADNSGRERL